MSAYKREEIENNIVWSKVGPDEMALIGKLQHASDAEIGAIVKELAKRDAVILPDQFGPTAEERMDDTRFWVGFLLRLAVNLVVWALPVTVVLGFLRFDEWFHLGAGAYAMRTMVAVMAGVVCVYYVWPRTDTSTWRRIILLALGHVFILIPLCVLDFFFVIPSVLTELLKFLKDITAGM